MTIVDDDSQLTNKQALTLEERTLFEQCESDIDEFRRSFIKAGKALTIIRDLRLYRETHSKFEDYCQERLGFKHSQAYRLIDAAKVIQILSHPHHTQSSTFSPIGESVLQSDNKLPTNESLVRPLTKLKQPEQIQQAWQNALEATSGKPTAEAVQNAVKELKGFLPRKPRKQPTVEQQGEGSDHTELADSQIDDYSTASAPQIEREGECTAAGIDSSAAYYSSVHDNENKNGNKDSQNPPLKETSSCQWIRDALQRRIMQILLYDQAVGMKIERLAKERGRLPQTIVAWAVDALEVLPAREERITELEVKLRQCREQASAQTFRLAELEQALAQKDDKLTELQKFGEGFDILKGDLEQKLTESEHYAAVASTRIAELERELFAALQTIASLKEQSLATTQASNNATEQPSNNSKPSATTPASSSNPVPNLKSLIDFFDRAAEKLEKPTVQIVLKDKTIVVSRNSNSYVGKHPGVLNLNTWDGVWHGRINRDGTLFKSREWQQWVLPILEEFASNPGAIASQQGKTTGSCCFCNRVLTDARSLQTGYGETCAKHYGLQWPLDAQKKEDSSPTIEQLKLETSQLEYQNDEPNATTKVGKMVEILSTRHGEEYLGIKGVIVFEDSQGYAVDVAGKELFYGADEVLLLESQERNQEIPF